MSVTEPQMSGVELLAQLEMAAGGAPVVYKDATNTSLDTGLCVLFDTAPLDPSASKEAAMLQSAEENTQLLIRGLFMLPSVEDPLYGPTATLPPRTTPLPRAMPPPQAKPPTRWEKFAQEKGIAKKGKRSRMVLDEPTGEYKPRFGYKRARDESSEWLYELKGNDRGDVDHIERRELEKQRRVVNNKMSQATNMERAAFADERRKGSSGGTRDFAAPEGGGGGREGGKGSKRPRGQSAPAGIPSIPIAEGRADVLAGPGRHAKARPNDTKTVKRAQISMAQVSTASMGKFDRKSNNEPVLKKDPLKRKRLPNEARDAERTRNANVLANVLKGIGAPKLARLPASSTTYQKPGKPGKKTYAPPTQPRAQALQKKRDEKAQRKQPSKGREPGKRKK